jgi:DNA-binding beta-propeller fold protein YncE
MVARLIALQIPFAMIGALVATGCRTLDAQPTDAGIEAGTGEAGPGGGPGETDAGVDTPSRREPPIVRPAQNVVVETLAGSATAGSLDGVGPAAQFENPVGVTLDPTGALLVTEYDGSRLRKIAPDGTTTTLAIGGLKEPFALLGTNDAIFVQTDVDVNGQKGAATGTIWRVGLGGGVPEPLVERLGRPRGLARLLDGRIVVSDRTRHTISILNPIDRSFTPLAGSGVSGRADGRGIGAQFNEPYGLTVLPDGNILVADSANHLIRKVTLEGDVTVFAGEGLPGMKDDADKLLARFDFPYDVAVDAIGNAYISDVGNHRIRRVTAGGSVETVAGTGAQGFADGPSAGAQFYGQEQLDVSPDGRAVYVSDGNGGDGTAFHRIRRIVVP